MAPDKIKIFEMFSGYGGASFSLKKAKIPYQCVGISEIDKDAIKCYNDNFKNVPNFGDCSKIDVNILPDFDLLTGGFPCQPFSEAGKHGGINDTRGTLFHHIIRIAEYKKPKYMILENVKGLTFQNHQKTLNLILSEIRRIGYKVDYRVLNSKNFGTPQSRERVVFLCLRDDINNPIVFPKSHQLKIFLKDIIEVDINFSYKKPNEIWRQGFKIENYPSKNIFSTDKHEILSVAIRNKNRAKHQHLNLPYGSFPVEHHLKYNEDLGVSYTVKSAKHEFMISNFELTKMRYLTSKEAFRLMGFFKDEIKLDVISETGRFKLAGNGWDINLFSQVVSSFLFDR